MMSNESSTTPQNHAENHREIPQDISELSYEQARDELVKTVSQLETGGAPLEESIALWERGESLAAHCENLLARAQQRLDAARPAP